GGKFLIVQLLRFGGGGKEGEPDIRLRNVLQEIGGRLRPDGLRKDGTRKNALRCCGAAGAVERLTRGDGVTEFAAELRSEIVGGDVAGKLIAEIEQVPAA